MTNTKSMSDISHILNHLGEEREKYFGSVSPPIFQSSNFCFATVAEMREALKNEDSVPFYTRGVNPTVSILREKVAALEGAEDALIFGSGSAAMAAGVMSSVKGGEHVICVKKPYSWTYKLLNKMLVNYGVESTMVDGTDIENFRSAIKPNTRLIILESPNSVTFEMQDIRAVAALAKQHNITTLIDNSYSTPIFQRPIEMGIDMTVHSASKYFGGHSDIVAGVLTGSKNKIAEIFQNEFMTLGGIISPNDAWLMLLGLRTLKIRAERTNATAAKVVEFMENHPKVNKVFFPFSKSNPQYELAISQMSGTGGMFSAQLKAKDIASVEEFCNSLKRFLLACSWGGHESLIFPTCTLYDSQNYGTTELPWNHIRFYVGLEEPEEIIEDLRQALEKI
jgi:cystathionine beta-lyase/cystathionine gamma-synthase